MLVEMKDKIKMLREKQGLTLEDVGRVVGVGKSTVRKWETGDIANMRRDKIAKLAEALHTSPAYLMGWEYDEKETSEEMLALMEQLSLDHANGRDGARAAMLETHGTEGYAHSIRLIDDKHVLLYYHAFDDSRSCNAASEMMKIIEKMTPFEAEHLYLLVEAYTAADKRARQMVDLALDPFLSEATKDWVGSLVPEPMPDAETISLAQQILQDKKAQDSGHVSNGDDGKKKEA